MLEKTFSDLEKILILGVFVSFVVSSGLTSLHLFIFQT